MLPPQSAPARKLAANLRGNWARAMADAMGPGAEEARGLLWIIIWMRNRVARRQ